MKFHVRALIELLQYQNAPAVVDKAGNNKTDFSFLLLRHHSYERMSSVMGSNFLRSFVTVLPSTSSNRSDGSPPAYIRGRMAKIISRVSTVPAGISAPAMRDLLK